MRTNSNRIVSVVICGLLVFESVVLGATGQGSAGTSPTAASAQSAAAESGDGRARWLADHQAWRDYRLRNPTSVFSFEQLSSIFAEQRAIERFVEAFTITQELTAGWQDSLRRAAQETEIDHIHTDVVEIQEAYEELHAEYERLAEEANDRGAGLLGMIASLAVNMVVSAIPGAGPVLGSAVAAGFSKAINGGSFGEVLFAMGLAAGASFVAQEVSEAMLPDAELVENGSVAPPSQAMLNQASAGAAVAGFSVSQPGTEFMRMLSQVPSPTFSPQLIAATADPRGRPMVVRRTSDLEQAVGNALRRLSAGASEAGPAPDAAPRPDVARRGPQASGARSLSDRVWAARQVEGGFQPALSGDSLLVIHALQREIEKLLFAYQVDRELNMRVRRGLERMVREAEAINLSADREQAVEAYEDLLAAYEQLREDIRNRGGGLFGAICSLVGTVVGTLIGGPFLGAAFAGAIGVIANGGHVGEALVMAGFNTGVTYAYSVAVPALRNVLAGSPAVDGGQTSLDEMIDAELAEEIESFYIDPVLEGGEDDSFDPGTGAGVVQADGGGDMLPGVGAASTGGSEAADESVVAGGRNDSFGVDGATGQPDPRSSEMYLDPRYRNEVRSPFASTNLSDGDVLHDALEVAVPPSQSDGVYLDPRYRNEVRSPFASANLSGDDVLRDALEATSLLDGYDLAANNLFRYDDSYIGQGGPPSSWESMIPIHGPFSMARFDFKQGNYLSASFNVAVGFSDAAVVGLVAKGLWQAAKLGGYSITTVRNSYKARGLVPKEHQIHHALIRNSWDFIPTRFRNHPLNLVVLPKDLHLKVIHGRGFGSDVLFWNGTPSWFKAGLFSIVGHRQLSTQTSPTGPVSPPLPTGPVSPPLPTGPLETEPVEDFNLVTKGR